MKLNPYHLTPLGETWGWRLRIAEIVLQTLGAFVVRPLFWAFRGVCWVLSSLVD